MIMIRLDRDMLLTELYDIRARITELTVDPDETRPARARIDSLINLVANAVQDEHQAALPRISARRR